MLSSPEQRAERRRRQLAGARAAYRAESAIVRWVPRRGEVVYWRATLGDRIVGTAGGGAALETHYTFRSEGDTRWRRAGSASVPHAAYRRLREQLRAGRVSGRETVYERELCTRSR